MRNQSGGGAPFTARGIRRKEELMAARVLDAIPLPEIARAGRQHLGEPSRFRVSCVTQRSDVNRFRHVEFNGWLVGWGEGLRDARNEPVTRTETTVYLSAGGRIILGVNVVPHTVHLILGSPPDHWAMYLGDQGSLESAAAWFATVCRAVGERSIAREAGAAALDAARTVLSRIGRAEADLNDQQHERLAILVGGRTTHARPPA